MTEYITKEELESLKKELEYLKTTKTKEIAELIKQTASFGDLKENFAYHDAKDKQAFLQGKIIELNDKIRNSQIIEKGISDKIQIGSEVLINIEGDKEKIIIVSPSQSDPIKGKISYQSPMGKAVLGKKEGDKAQFNTEGGKIELKILKIE